MSKKSEAHANVFIRHVELGAGIIISSEDNKTVLEIMDNNGVKTQKPCPYGIGDWRIKEIPEGSFGHVFFDKPEEVFSLIDSYSPELVDLLLKETGGEIPQAGIRELFEPIIKGRGYDWDVWWKKVALKLRKFKTISYVKKGKLYVLNDEPVQDDILSNINVNSAMSLPIEHLARLNKSDLEQIHDMKSSNAALIEALWTRVEKIFNEISPENQYTTAFIALGEVLAEALSAQKKWAVLLKNWVKDNEPNLFGVRDADIRKNALRAISRIEWPRKREVLGFYILKEESGEKNRKTASKQLWKACENNPQEYFDILGQVLDKMAVSKTPASFLSSRPARVVESSMVFIKSIQNIDTLEVFCKGTSRLLTSIFLKYFDPPMDYNPVKQALDIWFEWTTKAEALRSDRERWIVWTGLSPLLSSCSKYSRKKYFKDHDNIKSWVERITDKMLKLANDNIEHAEKLYELLALIKGHSEAEQIVKVSYQKGVFRSKVAQEWAHFHTVTDREAKGIIDENQSAVNNELAELAFHPREMKMATDIARLLLMVKGREPLLSEIENTFSRLVQLYEQSSAKAVQDLKSFGELLMDECEYLRVQLNLSYIGKLGSIEEYDPRVHKLVQKDAAKPNFVKIIMPGVARKQKDAPPEILHKAIVKNTKGE